MSKHLTDLRGGWGQRTGKDRSRNLGDAAGRGMQSAAALAGSRRDEEAQTELLSLHRFGWISTAKRAGLSESANQTRLSRSVRMERDHPASGRSRSHTNRNRSPPRGRTKGGPVAQARRGIAPGTGSRGEEQRTAGDGVPRGRPSNRNYNLKIAAVDEAKYLQLAECLAGFRSKLRIRAEALDIAVRQQILRLLLKEVLAGGNTITLRHSIPIPQSGPGSNGSPGPSSSVTGSRPNPGYLLRSGGLLSYSTDLARETSSPHAVIITP